MRADVAAVRELAERGVQARARVVAALSMVMALRLRRYWWSMSVHGAAPHVAEQAV